MVAASPWVSVARCVTSTAAGVPVHGSALVHRAPTIGTGSLASTTAAPDVATVPAVDVVFRAVRPPAREAPPELACTDHPIKTAASSTATANSAICRRRRTVRRRRAARAAAPSDVRRVAMQRNRVAVMPRSIQSYRQAGDPSAAGAHRRGVCVADAAPPGVPIPHPPGRALPGAHRDGLDVPGRARVVDRGHRPAVAVRLADRDLTVVQA